MNVSPLQRRIDAEDIPPERLAGNSHLNEQEKIAEASRQFEAILLRQVLENTQKTVIQSKFSDNSTIASVYRDLVTTQLADSISKSGAFGLARTFEQQLNRSPAPSSKAGDGGTPDALPTSQTETASRPHSRLHSHERGSGVQLRTEHSLRDIPSPDNNVHDDLH